LISEIHVTSALNGGGGSASFSSYFTLIDRSPSTLLDRWLEGTNENKHSIELT